MDFKLNDFQLEDVVKLHRQQGAAIASEMGVGKTHEAIALDEAWWKKGGPPTLIVTPPNTFWSWRDKYGMQSPDSDVCVIKRTPAGREKFMEDLRLRRGDVFVTNYESMRLKDMRALRGMKFQTVVFDEAHRLSNRKSQQRIAAVDICRNSQHRLMMSGTLSGDKPADLWSPFNLLWPKFYTAYWKFRQKYCIDDYDPEKGYRTIVGVQDIDELMAEIAPWYVRHLKKERCCDHHPRGVMEYLPDKSYSRVWVDLSPRQRRIYEQMRKEMVAWVGDQGRNPLVAGLVITQLVRLSQIALAEADVRTVTKKRRKRDDEGNFIVPTVWEYYQDDEVFLTGESSKLDALTSILEDNPGKQFVVYSSSKQMVKLVHYRLETMGISSTVLSGETKEFDRERNVKAFIDGKYQVFISVIEAGAEGMDGLQLACDTAIFLDRSWRTIKNKQAEDRLHRGGQKNAVQIIDIMARNTVDYGRHQRLVEKWNWIKKMLGDYGHNTGLSYYDNEGLTKMLEAS